MSVKMKTTEQLHQDLASIHNLWAGGIPPEQNDSVNALKAELKRRGVDAAVIRPEMPVARGIESMTEDQLGAELRALSDRISKSPSDDDLQARFADIRFELRKRTKNGNGHEPKKTGAFDPVTGETDMQQAAKPSSFQDGAVSRHTTEMPRRDLEAEERQKAEFMAVQAERVRLMEQAVRKHNLAKVAADVSANILTKYDISNVDGDVIENACTIGLQVAQNIFAKVGL